MEGRKTRDQEAQEAIAWKPNAKQFAAYKRREVELALVNISAGYEEHGTPSRNNRGFQLFDDTLHSMQTIAKARAALNVDRSVRLGLRS